MTESLVKYNKHLCAWLSLSLPLSPSSSHFHSFTPSLIRSLEHSKTTPWPKIEKHLATKSVIAVTRLMKLCIHKNKNAYTNLLQSYKIRHNRWFLWQRIACERWTKFKCTNLLRHVRKRSDVAMASAQQR